jgi:Tol biopolymer transport system component
MKVVPMAAVALATVIVVGVSGWIADALPPPPLAPTTSSALAPEVTSGLAGQAPPPSVAGLKILFSAEELSPTGQSAGNGIFEVDSDGSNLRTLLSSASDSAVTYNWPQWALGGTKIVFTERTGPPVSSTDTNPQFENLWMMNADGTDLQQLTDYNYRAVQPKMSADGTSVLFAAENPQYQRIGVYTLNLRTLLATNVSQVTQPLASFDSDPNWTPSGGIIMSSSGQGPGINIDEIGSDGTNRQEIVSDGDFNTDAVVSPSGNEVAYSAFDGADPVAPGYTLIPSDPDDAPLNPQDWFIKVHNLSTGSTAVLNHGAACNGLDDNCQPAQSSGWQPIWSPDGSMLAWTGRIGATTECICAANADGSNPISLISTHGLILKWIDWIAPGGQVPPTAVTGTEVGSQASHSKLLLSSQPTGGGGPQLLEESPDMMTFSQLPTGAAPNPAQGRFSSDRSEYVFTADAGYDPGDLRYGPPPPGQQVHSHFTLEQIHPGLFPTYPPTDISPEEQVFLHTSSGSVVQLTTPWTEDWQDAIDPGDDRSNTDPVLSPDGHYVVFTNHSTLTGESFLLRMDLQTGAVLNLTNGTAGAVEVNDSLPAFSPDGSQIAFTWTDGSATDVYVMDAADGKVVRAVTDDNAFDMDPTWSPDGRSIVYSHYDGVLQPTPAQEGTLTGLPHSGWSLVKVDVATGAKQVLTQPSDSPTFRPAYSPDGTQIDFIGDRYGFLGMFQTTPDGAPVQPLLVDAQMSLATVDWR